MSLAAYCHPDVSGTGVADQSLDELLVRVAASISKLYAEASELTKGVFRRRGFELVCRRDFRLRGIPIHKFAIGRLLNRSSWGSHHIFRGDYAELPHGRSPANEPPAEALRHNPGYGIMK
jgi:hypothetical protein